MSSKPDARPNLYALTWRVPIIVWQLIFFVGPVLFMVAMSFFLVKNYRMTEAFEFVNWSRMLTRGFFWDSYWYTIFHCHSVHCLCDVHCFSCRLCFGVSRVRKHATLGNFPPHHSVFSPAIWCEHFLGL